MRTPAENLARGVNRSMIYAFENVEGQFSNPWIRVQFMQEFIEADVVSMMDDPVFYLVRLEYYVDLRLCTLPTERKYYH